MHDRVLLYIYIYFSFSNSVGGGMLFERIVERNTLTEADCALYMKQVLQGVHHLHRQHIVHLELRVC